MPAACLRERATARVPRVSHLLCCSLLHPSHPLKRPAWGRNAPWPPSWKPTYTCLPGPFECAMRTLLMSHHHPASGGAASGKAMGAGLAGDVAAGSGAVAAVQAAAVGFGRLPLPLVSRALGPVWESSPAMAYSLVLVFMVVGICHALLQMGATLPSPLSGAAYRGALSGGSLAELPPAAVGPRRHPPHPAGAATDRQRLARSTLRGAVCSPGRRRRRRRRRRQRRRRRRSMAAAAVTEATEATAAVRRATAKRATVKAAALATVAQTIGVGQRSAERMAGLPAGGRWWQGPGEKTVAGLWRLPLEAGGWRWRQRRR
jgi:hypothetical protein